MAHLFRIDGLTSAAAVADFRRAVAARDPRLALEIDSERGLVGVEGAEGAAIEQTLQAASTEARVAYRGPIARHRDAP